MDKDQYIVYRQFYTLASASDLAILFQQNSIDYVLEYTISSAPGAPVNNSKVEIFCIRISASDFEKANSLLSKPSDPPPPQPEPYYYLDDLADEELLDLVYKADEWNEGDYQYALKALQARGKGLSNSDIEKIKEQRIAELSKPVSADKWLLAAGYVLSAFGIPGLSIGLYYRLKRRVLPNGQRVHFYQKADRTQGTIIAALATGFIIFIFGLAMIRFFQKI